MKETALAFTDLLRTVCQHSFLTKFPDFSLMFAYFSNFPDQYQHSLTIFPDRGNPVCGNNEFNIKL